MVNVNVKVRLAVLAEFDLRWNLMLRFKERLTDLTPSLQKMSSDASHDSLHVFCFHMTQLVNDER